MVRLLLDKKADINGVRASQDPASCAAPIMIACIKGHLEVLNVLLEYKADCTVQDNTACTPLILSTRHKYYSLAGKLIEYAERELQKNAESDVLNVNHVIFPL